MFHTLMPVTDRLEWEKSCIPFPHKEYVSFSMSTKMVTIIIYLMLAIKIYIRSK